MSAYPVPLTPNQAESVFQLGTMALLGIDPTAPDAYAQVRVAWQQTGQPAWGIKENVAIVRMVEVDDPYNRIRDVQNVLGADETVVGQLTTYTRVWEVFWTLYGPSSFTSGRKIRSGLFTQALHDVFTAQNVAMYLITDPAAPRRIPELYEGQWWERVDFSARFNELVYESTVVPTIASAEIIVETRNGIVRDIVATTILPIYLIDDTGQRWLLTCVPNPPRVRTVFSLLPTYVLLNDAGNPSITWVLSVVPNPPPPGRYAGELTWSVAAQHSANPLGISIANDSGAVAVLSIVNGQLKINALAPGAGIGSPLYLDDTSDGQWQITFTVNPTRVQTKVLAQSFIYLNDSINDDTWVFSVVGSNPPAARYWGELQWTKQQTFDPTVPLGIPISAGGHNYVLQMFNGSLQVTQIN